MELITGPEEGARLHYMTPWEMAKSFLNLESSLHLQQNELNIGMGFNKILVEKFNESLLTKLPPLLESLAIMLLAPVSELHCGSKAPIPMNNT